MIRVNFYLARTQIAKLKALAKKSGLSVSEYVRRAIDDLLDREERKERKRNE